MKLLRFEAATAPSWSLDLAPLLKQPSFVAMDPRARHLWVAGKDAILRLNLADRTTAVYPFAGNALRAVDAGLDGSLWMLGNKELWHYAADGTLVGHIDLHPIVSSEPKFLAVDSLGNVVWVAGEKSVLRFDPESPATTALTASLPDTVAALALNRRTGSIFAAGNDRLSIFRHDATLAVTVDLKALGIKDVVGLAFDAASSSLWAIHNGTASRLTTEGLVVSTVPLAKNPEVLAVTPLRLAPTVAILGPADGLLTNNATPPLTLQYGAMCSGAPCGFGFAAFEGYRLATLLNGAPSGIAFAYDPSTGKTSGMPVGRLAEGLNRLETRVTDTFGNESDPAISQFTIDTIPPRFIALAPADGASVTSPSISLTGSLDEAATILVAGEGASATAQGTSFSFPVTLKTGLNTFNVSATDAAGNVSSTTVRVTLANAIAVKIDSPVAGATLSGSDVLVTGSVDGPPNTGVVVNGIAASREGTRFFAAVPIQEGALDIEAAATSPDGATASTAISVTVTALPDYEVVPTFRTAFAPTGMAFKFVNRTDRTIVRVDADFDGDGVIDNYSTSPNPVFSTAYYSTGTFNPKFRLRDSSGRIYALTTQVIVRDKAALDQELRGIWNGFTAELASRNIAGALAYFNTPARERYAAALDTLRDNLPSIVASFSEPLTFSITDDIGEYVVNRLDNGADMAYFIYFLRDVDGVWRLDSM